MPAPRRGQRWVYVVVAVVAFFAFMQWLDRPLVKKTSRTNSAFSCGDTPAPEDRRTVVRHPRRALDAPTPEGDEPIDDLDAGTEPSAPSVPVSPEQARLDRLARAYSTEPPNGDATVVVHVVDDRNTPVSKAIMGLVSADRRRRHRVSEGEPGTYTLAQVPSGTWTLRVFALGSAAVADEIVLASGETKRLEFRLERALQISGRVVDGTGAPVPQFLLGLFAVESKGAKRFAQLDSAETSAEGAFVFFGVGAGRYRLEPANGIPLRTQVEVTAPASDVVVKLDRLLLTGKVSDGAGAPIGNARLELAPQGDPVRVDPDEPIDLPRAKGAADGGFSLLYDAPGSYDLHVRARGFKDKRIALNLGAGGGKQDVVLEPLSSFRGVVVNTRGEPIEGATVWLESGTDSALESRTTDETGRFELTGVDGDDLVVRARKGEDWSAPVPAREGELRLELTRKAPRVRGRVVDPRGVPVTRFKIGNDEFTAGDGRFEWFAPSAGATELRVEGEFVPVDVPMTLREGETTDVGDVRVIPLAKLTGRLLAYGTASPSNCELEAVIRDDAYPGSVEWEGRYSVEIPASEQAILNVRCTEGWARKSASCASGGCDSDITLEPGGALRLKLANGPGPASVRVSGPNGIVVDHFELAAEAKTIAGIAPGHYAIERLGRTAPPAVDADVKVGATVDVIVPDPL